MKHTPGPWRNHEGYILQGNSAIAVVAGENKANARLIAAAPELLDAITCYLEKCDHRPHSLDETMDKAEKAYQQATGEGDD